MFKQLPEDIINKIIEYKLLFNTALDNDINKYIASFDFLIIDSINHNYNKFHLKSLKSIKIITNFYQPEEAFYIPFVDDTFYWKFLKNNFNTISTFKLNRNFYEINCQNMYKNDLFIYYYTLNKKNK